MVTAPDAALAGDNFERLHRELLADPALQFAFEQREPPQPPPSWLEPLVRLLEFLAPFLSYIFWAGVIVVAAMIVYAIATELMRRLPQQRREAPPPKDIPVAEFRPAAARAHALLEEADRLAREGRYDEAVRILLHRSIEDMEAAYPATIAPSMTSREISMLGYLSQQGRATFAKIAQAVERSLFAGRGLTAEQFAECRRAYENFALEAPAT
jgi:Domain of unknown function (DUF4129)